MSGADSAFSYFADPHLTALPSVAVKTPATFPYTPSQCVALIGLACYTPQEIRRAYNVPANLTGAGRTIVIVDAYGSPTIDADLKLFDRYFGLPDPPSFSVVYPGGAPVYNPLQHHNEEGWAGETTLDVEWAHAVEPGANIVLVVAANNGGDVLKNAVRYAVDHHLGDVISQSFGSPEANIAGGGNNLLVQQADLAFRAAKAANISVVAAAGDWGATNHGITKAPAGVNALFPASDPLVTGVGGTAIFAADDGTYGSESGGTTTTPARSAASTDTCVRERRRAQRDLPGARVPGVSGQHATHRCGRRLQRVRVHHDPRDRIVPGPAGVLLDRRHQRGRAAVGPASSPWRRRRRAVRSAISTRSSTRSPRPSFTTSRKATTPTSGRTSRPSRDSTSRPAEGRRTSPPWQTA